MVRCFSLGSASDLVSNCGAADKAGVAGSFLSGAFCFALVPFLSDPAPKAPGNKKDRLRFCSNIHLPGEQALMPA